jgi:hypothetical protein
VAGANALQLSPRADYLYLTTSVTLDPSLPLPAHERPAWHDGQDMGLESTLLLKMVKPVTLLAQIRHLIRAASLL